MGISGSKHERDREVINRSPLSSKSRLTSLPGGWLMVWRLWFKLPLASSNRPSCLDATRVPKDLANKNTLLRKHNHFPLDINDCELTKQKENEAPSSCLSPLLAFT